MEELSKEQDFYWEGSFLVFTRQLHLRRGSCCGSGCRHCPYDPRWTKGETEIATEITDEGNDAIPFRSDSLLEKNRLKNRPG